MKNYKLLAIALLLLSFTASGYVVKESEQDTDIKFCVNKGGTVSCDDNAIDGATGRLKTSGIVNSTNDGPVVAPEGIDVSGQNIKADSINVDTITEHTTDNGVSVEGVVLKDTALNAEGAVFHKDEPFYVTIASDDTQENAGLQFDDTLSGKKWRLFKGYDVDHQLFFTDASDYNVMTLTQGGNVGIGTTSPSNLLYVTKVGTDNSALLRLYQNGNYDALLQLGNNGVNWYVGADYSNSQAFTINNSSDFSDPDFYITTAGNAVGKKIQAYNANSALTVINADHVNTSTSTVSANNETLLIRNLDQSSNNANRYAALGFAVAGSSGATSNASISGIYRGAGNMDLDFLLENGNALYSQFKLQYNGAIFAPNINSGAGTHAQCYNTSTGQFTYNASCTASSIKFKKDVVDLEDEINTSEVIDKLRPVVFTFKEEHKGVHQRQIGFIAEEIDEILPHVSDYNDNGEPETLQYDKMVALLVAEVQSLRKRVAELENK